MSNLELLKTVYSEIVKMPYNSMQTFFRSLYGKTDVSLGYDCLDMSEPFVKLVPNTEVHYGVVKGSRYFKNLRHFFPLTKIEDVIYYSDPMLSLEEPINLTEVLNGEEKLVKSIGRNGFNFKVARNDEGGFSTINLSAKKPVEYCVSSLNDVFIEEFRKDIGNVKPKMVSMQVYDEEKDKMIISSFFAGNYRVQAENGGFLELEDSIRETQRMLDILGRNSGQKVTFEELKESWNKCFSAYENR